MFPVPLTPDVKRRFEANDPKALAAERIGRIEYPRTNSTSDGCRLRLWSTAAEMTSLTRRAYSSRIENRVTRDRGLRHGGAFAAVDSVMPLAIDFLRTVASS